MANRLESYERKRDFAATPEPSGASNRSEDGGRFVIQEHSATRMHWDLRLEHDGTLASWALPRGVPADPEQNRKAVRTEDHPLEYLEFEGDIPEGSYGAGSMRIWDRGKYDADSWEERKVKVTLHGKRVNGRYALFHTGPDHKDWMIHRIDPPLDPDAEPLPEDMAPMLASPGDLPEAADEYGFEIRWTGTRALAYSEPGRIRIDSPEVEEATATFRELRRLNRELGARQALLDGVVVAFDEEGRPSRERLNQRAHASSNSQIRRLERSVPVTYVIFDLLHLDGGSLLDHTYADRRRLLDELALQGESWQTPGHHHGDGRRLMAASAKLGLAGLVAKRLGSPYEPGRRSSSWIEIIPSARTSI